MDTVRTVSHDLSNEGANDWLSRFKSAIYPVIPPSTKQRRNVTFEKLGDISLAEDFTAEETAKWACKAGRRFQKRPADTAHPFTLPRPPAYRTPPEFEWTSQGMLRTTSVGAPHTLEQLQDAHNTAVEA